MASKFSPCPKSEHFERSSVAGGGLGNSSFVSDAMMTSTRNFHFSTFVKLLFTFNQNKLSAVSKFPLNVHLRFMSTMEFSFNRDERYEGLTDAEYWKELFLEKHQELILMRSTFEVRLKAHIDDAVSKVKQVRLERTRIANELLVERNGSQVLRHELSVSLSHVASLEENIRKLVEEKESSVLSLQSEIQVNIGNGQTLFKTTLLQPKLFYSTKFGVVFVTAS